jgi:hypothetical protein
LPAVASCRHRSSNFGLAENRPLGDGVVTGYGTIDEPEPALRLHLRLGNRRAKTAPPDTLPVTSSTGTSSPSPSALLQVCSMVCSIQKVCILAQQLNHPFVRASPYSLRPDVAAAAAVALRVGQCP